MPEALTQFQHAAPKKPQHQLYPHVKPTYGAKVQYAEDDDTSPLLNKTKKTFIQEVIGTLIYNAQCVNSTMLTALGSLATQQANPTVNTMIKVSQFLDYAATHPDAIVTYHASNMVLAGHSNASYLLESKARSRGGHFLHVNRHGTTTQQWGSPHNCPNHKGSHDICCRSRNLSLLHQLLRDRPRTTYTGIHGTPPITNPDANGQHNSAWHGQ